MQTYYNAYDLSKFMFLSEEKLTQIVKSTLKKVTLTAVSYTHLDVYKRQE